MAYKLLDIDESKFAHTNIVCGVLIIDRSFRKAIDNSGGKTHYVRIAYAITKICKYSSSRLSLKIKSWIIHGH